MRTSSILISGAVAAVVVAGSANAAIVSHLNLNQAWDGVNGALSVGRLLNITSANNGGGSTVASFLFGVSTGNKVIAGRFGPGGTSGSAQAMTSALNTAARIFSYGEYSAPMSLAYMGMEANGSNFNFGSTYGSSIAALNGTTGYLGFAIFDIVDPGSSEIGNVRYGWIQFTGNAGLGGTIVGYAYDTTGATIAAGYIPAPGAVALLGVAGMIGSRRRKA
jgi:hypothetical protein